MKLSRIIQTLEEIKTDLGDFDVEVHIEENTYGEEVLCVDVENE
jgi:hypothetical protein